MTTLPLLNALHTALYGTVPLRRDVQAAARLMTRVTGQALRPAAAHLNSARQVDAIGFLDGERLIWCGLTNLWPVTIHTQSTPAERQLQHGEVGYDHWSRDDLLTALSERPHGSDPLHQQLRTALDRHPNTVLHAPRRAHT